MKRYCAADGVEDVRVSDVQKTLVSMTRYLYQHNGNNHTRRLHLPPIPFVHAFKTSNNDEGLTVVRVQNGTKEMSQNHIFEIAHQSCRMAFSAVAGLHLSRRMRISQLQLQQLELTSYGLRKPDWNATVTFQNGVTVVDTGYPNPMRAANQIVSAELGMMYTAMLENDVDKSANHNADVYAGLSISETLHQILAMGPFEPTSTIKPFPDLGVLDTKCLLECASLELGLWAA